MFSLAVTTTSVLVCVCLLAKTLHPPDEHPQTGEIFRQALYWKDVAAQDRDPLLRLQHLCSAAAFLKAARMLARDPDLERLSGHSPFQLQQSLERKLDAATHRATASQTSSTATHE